MNNFSYHRETLWPFCVLHFCMLPTQQHIRNGMQTARPSLTHHTSAATANGVRTRGQWDLWPVVSQRVHRGALHEKLLLLSLLLKLLLLLLLLLLPLLLLLLLLAALLQLWQLLLVFIVIVITATNTSLDIRLPPPLLLLLLLLLSVSIVLLGGRHDLFTSRQRKRPFFVVLILRGKFTVLSCRTRTRILFSLSLCLSVSLSLSHSYSFIHSFIHIHLLFQNQQHSAEPKAEL